MERPLTTARLILRGFEPDDWPLLQGLAIDMRDSGGTRFDHAWPTDEAGARAMAEWCAGQEGCFAVCLRYGEGLVGMIRVGDASGNGRVEIGHMFHSQFRGQALQAEGIGAVLAGVFSRRNVTAVFGRNALEWQGQITPLVELGFREAGRGAGTFSKDAAGREITFTAVDMELSRDAWAARIAESLG